MALINHTKY